MSSLRTLNKNDYRTLGLASLGGALEYYDFIIFIFFTVQLKNVVMPATMSPWLATTWTYGILAAGYLVRPIGGVIMAHLGDMLGRKRIFTFSILLMAVATLGMAFVPSYQSVGIAAPLILLVLRMMQGLAVGGEVPGAWTFVAEHVPQRYVGFATGVLTSGLSLGILIGSLTAYLIKSQFSSEFVGEWGWRLAFIIGGGFGLCAVWLRRLLQETPIFKEMKERRALAKKMPLSIVLSKHLDGVVVSMFLTWVLSAAVMISTLLTPTYLEAAPYHYSGDTALAANCVTSLFLILGTPVAGMFCDKIGSGRFFAVAGLCFAVVSYIFYHYAGISVVMLFFLSALLGFFAGFVGGVAYVMIRSFPAAVRFTGLSFSYNVSYAIFGGLTPLMISLIHYWLPLAHAWYLLAVSILASLIGVYLIFYGERRQLPVGIEEEIKK